MIDKSIQVSDLRTVVAAIGAWFLDVDGGIALATKLLIALASLSGLVVLARIIRGLAKRHLRGLPRISNLLRTFLAGLVFWVVLAVGLPVVLALPGVQGTPLLALLGGASVIIGLALQNTLGNFAKGLMIMINRPFDEGDYVDIGGTAGTVEAVSIVATTIANPDNQVIVIPNYLTVYRGLLADVKVRFDAAGITIPYPQRDLHLDIVGATALAGPPDPRPTVSSDAADR